MLIQLHARGPTEQRKLKFFLFRIISCDWVVIIASSQYIDDGKRGKSWRTVEYSKDFEVIGEWLTLWIGKLEETSWQGLAHGHGN